MQEIFEISYMREQCYHDVIGDRENMILIVLSVMETYTYNIRIYYHSW